MDPEEKYAINLKCLQSKLSKHIYRYSSVYPLCTVYQFSFDKNEWEKLQVDGPLFTCYVDDSDCIIVVVLNKTPFINPQPFIMEICPSYYIKQNKSQVYISTSMYNGRNICFSFNSELDAITFSREFCKNIENNNNNYNPKENVEENFLIRHFSNIASMYHIL